MAFLKINSLESFNTKQKYCIKGKICVCKWFEFMYRQWKLYEYWKFFWIDYID